MRASLEKQFHTISVPRLARKMTPYGPLVQTMDLPNADGTVTKWVPREHLWGHACKRQHLWATGLHGLCGFPHRIMSIPWRCFMNSAWTMLSASCCQILNITVSHFEKQHAHVLLLRNQNAPRELRLDSIDSRPDHEGELVFYADEFRPGNPLRPDKVSSCASA